MSKEDLKDTLGARMKRYEALQDTQLMPGLPLYARVDGRHFSKFTRGFGYPYPELMHKCGYELSTAMQRTADALCKEFNCTLVETHSDEISLAWTDVAKAPFDGRHFKLVSNIASYAGAVFMHEIGPLIPDRLAHGEFPSFDCRVFQVPDLWELANLFVWRQNDCMRGCLNQYAQQFLSHKQLMGMSCDARREMCRKNGHDFDNNVADVFKYGYFCHKVLFEIDVVAMSSALKTRVANMPDKVVRSKVDRFPITRKIADVENKPGYLFDGEEPVLKEESNA